MHGTLGRQPQLPPGIVDSDHISDVQIARFLRRAKKAATSPCYGEDMLECILREEIFDDE